MRGGMSPVFGEFRLMILPQPGYSAQEIMNAIHAGEIKALFSICFNPLVSLPNSEFTREALEKLEFFCVIDFFLSETARFADVILAGSLQEEEEGVTCSAEGRVIHIQNAVDPPPNARRDSEIICDLNLASREREILSFSRTARNIRGVTRGFTRRSCRLLWDEL
jgi:assimilatory nitrate reductase catalytic subunit